MSDAKFQLTIKEDDSLLFKKSVRKLLDTTFILKEKDERLYHYIAKESNRLDISEYLKLIGFDIQVDDKCKLAMLIAAEDDEDTVGLKKANVITFTTLQYHLLLVLWGVYLENLGYDENNMILKGDLIDKIKAYGLIPGQSEMNVALKLFKKHNFINYDEKESGEDAIIELYPSLQFGWDVPQFKTIAEQYLHQDSQDEDYLPLEEEEDADEFDEEEGDE